MLLQRAGPRAQETTHFIFHHFISLLCPLQTFWDCSPGSNKQHLLMSYRRPSKSEMHPKLDIHDELIASTSPKPEGTLTQDLLALAMRILICNTNLHDHGANLVSPPLLARCHDFPNARQRYCQLSKKLEKTLSLRSCICPQRTKYLKALYC